MNRPRQVRTVSSLSDSIRAITALDTPSGAANTIRARTTRRWGAFCERASAVSGFRIASSMSKVAAAGAAIGFLPAVGARGLPAAKKITTVTAGSRQPAGQGTIQLMARLSDTAKTTLQRRVAAHHAQHWPQLSSLDVHWRGSYAYIDAATPDGHVQQLCRLKWNGHHDHWEFAIYLASRDGYEPNVLPSGWPTGTPEEAIDCAGLLYLNDWTQPPKN